MHSVLYAFVVDCFEHLEAHDTSNADYDQQAVLHVDEAAGFGVMNEVYDFDGWTFDTCSPLQLRFSQRGTPAKYTTAAPMWKCLGVDLLDQDLVVKENPEECTVVLSISKPEYRLLVGTGCVIFTKNKLTSVYL